MAPRMLLVLSTLVLSGGLQAFADEGATPATYRFARLSLVEGHVSFQHSGDVDWSAATVNLALQPGDRVYTGEDGRAEIEFDDGSLLRLAEKADAEILTLKEERIQLRLLVGLVTLATQSSIPFEVDTPAAAYTALRKGVYRFDVMDSGDTDAIVRKGLLDAASSHFSRRIEAGELLHATVGDNPTQTVAKYTARDAWDEWNDRRTADSVAYDSRKYLPGYVTLGVRDLDRYGRWVDVDEYGPAWVPAVGAGWSPYWDGRWIHRPLWGWTWVSYEPWGWLPYHYGRWRWTSGFGWAWAPGPAFGFHFWSPGLVRFYRGPSWVSWCPLGPGDYYNANHYFYNPSYAYYLNDMRLSQRRGPGDLVNRQVAGAFRSATVQDFTDRGFGGSRSTGPTVAGDRPWERGRMVSERLDVAPTRQSVAPAPDRAFRRPAAVASRPVVIRSEPSVPASAGRYVRPTDRGEAAAAGAGAARPEGAVRSIGVGRTAEPAGAGSGSDSGLVPRVWTRRPEPGESSGGGRTYQTPPARGESSGATGWIPAGDVRNRSAEPGRGASPAPARRYESAPSWGAPRGGGSPERAAPQRGEPAVAPPSSEPRPPERRGPERNERRPEAPGASAYLPRVYRGVGEARSTWRWDRPAVQPGAPSRSSEPPAWQGRPPAYGPSGRTWGGGGFRRAWSGDVPAYSGGGSPVRSWQGGMPGAGRTFGGGGLQTGGFGRGSMAPSTRSEPSGRGGQGGAARRGGR